MGLLVLLVAAALVLARHLLPSALAQMPLWLLVGLGALAVVYTASFGALGAMLGSARRA